MMLSVPVCQTDPWPSDLEGALRKFSAFNDRIRILFLTRDRKSERPKAVVWALGPSDTSFASACLLWDMLHVYHLMGVLNWNEGVRQLQEDANHKGAKASFLLAHKFFGSISQKIVPAWNPACRMVYRHTKKGLQELVIPSFLAGDSWRCWSQLCLAMIHKVMLDKGQSVNSSPALMAKIAMGGFNILEALPRTDSEPVKSLVLGLSQKLKACALVNWSRGQESSEDPGIHGKRVKILGQLVAQGIHLLPGFEFVKEEAENVTKMNDSVYFQPVPNEDVEKQVLSALPCTDVTASDGKEIIECYL